MQALRRVGGNPWPDRALVTGSAGSEIKVGFRPLSYF